MRSMLALILLTALALPTYAATPIDETRPLSPTGRIDIDNLKGRIQVRAWDRNEVKLEGSLGRGVERLIVEGDRDRLGIKVRYPRSSSTAEPSVLLLTVPRRAELDIEAVSADVDVSGVAPARLEVENVSGDVEIAAAPGSLKVGTVSGDVRVTVNSADVDLESVSGDVMLRGRLNGKVNLESVSGDINVAVVGGERIRSLMASTVSGDAAITTALAQDGEIKVETVSGELTLRVPRDISARVSAETFSGDLRAPGARVQRPKYGPGASFETRYGEGKGVIRMESFSGNAVLQLQ